MALLCVLACGGCDLVATYKPVERLTVDAPLDAALDAPGIDAIATPPGDAPSEIVSTDVPGQPVDATYDGADASVDGPTGDLSVDAPGGDAGLVCERPLSAARNNADYNDVKYVASRGRIYAVGGERVLVGRRLIISTFNLCGQPTGARPLVAYRPASARNLVGDSVVISQLGPSLMLCLTATRQGLLDAFDSGYVACFSLDSNGVVSSTPVWQQPLANISPPAYLAAGDALLLVAARHRADGKLARTFLDLKTGSTVYSSTDHDNVDMAGAVNANGYLVVGYAKEVNGTTVLAHESVPANCTQPASCFGPSAAENWSGGAATAFTHQTNTYAWIGMIGGTPRLLTRDNGTLYGKPMTGFNTVDRLIIRSNDIFGVGSDGTPMLMRSDRTATTYASARRSSANGALRGVDALPGDRLVLVGTLGSHAALEICRTSNCLMPVP